MTKQIMDIKRIAVKEMKNGIEYIGHYKAIKKDDLKTIRDYIILDKYDTEKYANIAMEFLERLFEMESRAMIAFSRILENNELDQAITEIEKKFIIRII